MSEGVLAEAIHEARRSLGDDAGQGAFIRTVHKRGYQFVFPVVEIVSSQDQEIDTRAASFWIEWNGGLTALRQGENFIGRDATCRIVLVGSRVSRRHARVDVSKDAAVAHDLGSKNGTSISGERLSAPRRLRDGRRDRDRRPFAHLARATQRRFHLDFGRNGRRVGPCGV